MSGCNGSLLERLLRASLMDRILRRLSLSDAYMG